MTTLAGSVSSTLGAGLSDLGGTPGLAAAAVTAGVVGVAALRGTVSLLQGRSRRSAADRKREAKRERCRGSIEELQARLDTSPMSNEEVQRITGMKLPELIQQLKDGQLTPPQALRAYQTKALRIHARTNCLIEVVTEAERWAQELAEGPKDGILYGVPISVKEDIALKGYDSTMGCVELTDKPAQDDAAIIKVLKRHGAIPFVRTNIPQFCMSFEPGNPIFGKVLHPQNPNHGPGGSSSGEACLTAAGGSPLGVGSDLAGSVRVPAHFTGVCGFKPTSQRMSNVGCLAGYACYEQNELSPVFGPLAKEVNSIVLAFRALWDRTSPSLTDLDPTSLPLAFNDQVFESERKLRIGYYTEDGLFPVFPGCARAVHEAKAALEAEGHELVPWRIPDLERARELLFAVCLADGGDLQRQMLKYDQIDPTIAPLFTEESSMMWLWRAAATIIKPVLPEYARQLEAVEGEPDLTSYFYLVSQCREYVVEVSRQWKEAGIDAVLCPPFAMPSPPWGNADLCMESGAYTMAYNALNFPCGVVPVTKVTAEDIDNLRDYPEDEPLFARAKKVMSETLDMPMGVMLVGARYNDEICLRLMKEIDSSFKNQRKC